MMSYPPASLPQLPRFNNYGPFPQPQGGTKPFTSFPLTTPYNPVSGVYSQPGIPTAPIVPGAFQAQSPVSAPSLQTEVQSNQYPGWLTPTNLAYGALALGGVIGLGLGLKSILKNEASKVPEVLKSGKSASEAKQAAQSTTPPTSTATTTTTTTTSATPTPITQGATSTISQTKAPATLPHQPTPSQAVTKSTESVMPARQPWNYKKTAIVATVIPASLLLGRVALSRAGYSFTVPVLDPLFEAGKSSFSSCASRVASFFKSQTADSARQFSERMKNFSNRDTVHSFLPKASCKGHLGNLIDKMLKRPEFENAYPGKCAEMQQHLETVGYPQIINNLNRTDVAGIRKMLSAFSRTAHPDKLGNHPDKETLAANYRSVSDSLRSLIKILSERSGLYRAATEIDLTDFNAGRFKL